jgi:hypothetical protein
VPPISMVRNIPIIDENLDHTRMSSSHLPESLFNIQVHDKTHDYDDNYVSFYNPLHVNGASSQFGDLTTQAGMSSAASSPLMQEAANPMQARSPPIAFQESWSGLKERVSY